jgi:hypothetical protein
MRYEGSDFWKILYDQFNSTIACRAHGGDQDVFFVCPNQTPDEGG